MAQAKLKKLRSGAGRVAGRAASAAKARGKTQSDLRKFQGQGKAKKLSPPRRVASKGLSLSQLEKALSRGSRSSQKAAAKELLRRHDPKKARRNEAVARKVKPKRRRSSGA